MKKNDKPKPVNYITFQKNSITKSSKNILTFTRIYINQVKLMEVAVLQKVKVHIIVEIIEYLPNAVVSKTIVKKKKDNIMANSFDAGEELAEKNSPFYNYRQIIDGTAPVTIHKNALKLAERQGIINPALASDIFKFWYLDFA
jgi:hypothetical protein